MRYLTALLIALWFVAGVVPAQAQTPLDLMRGNTNKTAETAAPSQASERDVQDLLRLLSNPALVEQLKQRSGETGEAGEAGGFSLAAVQRVFQRTLTRVKERARVVGQALRMLPNLPDEISAAAASSIRGSESLRTVIHIIIFLFGGFGLEWLYWSYLSATLKRVELSKPGTYGELLKAGLVRATLLFGSIAVFAVGSIGLFAAFEWSAFIEHIVISLVTGIIVMRLIIMAAVFILAPKVDQLRLLPLSKAVASNIYRWILAVTGLGLVGFLVVDRLALIGVPAASVIAVESLAGLIFVAAMIGAFWHINAVFRRGIVTQGVGADVVIDPALPTPGNFKIVFTSAIVVVAYLLWLADLDAVLWTLVTVALLFPAIKLARVMIDHIFDCVEQQISVDADDQEDGGEGEENATEEPNRYMIYRPIADRLIRFLLVIIAVVTIGLVWDVTSMLEASSNSFAEKVFGIIIDIVFALLIADLIWTWAKTAIEQKLSTYPVPQPGHAPGPEARMATLLPMFQKALMVTIIIMVALIIVSSLGVNIGPILAGAGVLGIALGFGAQALVKDIFSGVFFLIDDAFRVGEYIEMGELRGTVESVSIRSLRVRHHRGALHTIPYGELSSLTNYSRDWVIMKLQFRVPFDTDLKLAKKIVKRVSAQLSENEVYGQHFIEPLKFQGVRRMEEFNMVIGVKFMAVPGEQWTIRRDTYQTILDEFEANGIKLASRNVQVEVVSDRQLTEEEADAAVGAAQDAIEQQAGAAPEPAKS